MGASGTQGSLKNLPHCQKFRVNNLNFEALLDIRSPVSCIDSETLLQRIFSTIEIFDSSSKFLRDRECQVIRFTQRKLFPAIQKLMGEAV